MKSLKKIFSALLIMSIMLTTFAVTSFGADTAYVDETIDISPYATGKFWISLDDEASNAYYNTNENSQRYYNNYVVASDGVQAPARFPIAALVNSTEATVIDDGSTSKQPKVQAADGTVWTLPKKTAVDGTLGNAPNDVPESIIFSYYSNILTKTIAVNDKYDSVKFLINIAKSDVKNISLNIYAAYDGEEEVLVDTLDAAELTALASTITLQAQYGVAASYPNFHSGTAWTPAWVTNNTLRAYTIDTDVSKTLDNIRFEVEYAGASAEKIGIAAIIGSRPAKAYERTYEAIDISAKANSKFYIDPTDTNDTQTTLKGQLHFLHDDNNYNNPYYKGAEWPLSIRTHSDSDGFPVQDGFVSADNSRVIVSKNSGVSYTLPAKNTDTEKEIIVVEEFSRYSYGYSGKVREVTVDASGNYDMIHVLVANAVSGTNKQPFNITATYTNGETKVMSVENLPKANAAAAAANENFVADLTTYSRKHRRDTSTDPDTYEWHTDTPSFTEITDGTAAGIALYEYELDLDPSLTLQSIKFDVTKNISSKTVGIVAVTGEKIESEIADVATLAPVVEDGKVTVTAACPVETAVFMAVYDSEDKLVAAGNATFTAENGMGADIVAASDDITADGEYSVKLFMWQADGTLAPITLPETL